MSAASRLAAICYPTLLKYRAHWLMLTARPEGGNSVGKYACVCLGRRCPPNFGPLAKRSWKRGVFLHWSSSYKRHPRELWKERSNRLQFRGGKRSSNIFNMRSCCCLETLGCQKTRFRASIHRQEHYTETHTHLNLKAPSAGSVNNYQSGTAVIECAGRWDAVMDRFPLAKSP